jgi:hypothetical protein
MGGGAAAATYALIRWAAVVDRCHTPVSLALPDPPFIEGDCDFFFFVWRKLNLGKIACSV